MTAPGSRPRRRRRRPRLKIYHVTGPGLTMQTIQEMARYDGGYTDLVTGEPDTTMSGWTPVPWATFKAQHVTEHRWATFDCTCRLIGKEP